MDLALREILYRLAHGHAGGTPEGGGVLRLAEDMGVSPSILSRWISPFEQEDPRLIPAERLVQFCRLTGSAEPLAHLAAKLGLLLFKVPGARKRSGGDTVHFSRAVGEVLGALPGYFEGPTPEAKARALNSLGALMREAASYRLAVQKHQPMQPHLSIAEEDRP